MYFLSDGIYYNYREFQFFTRKKEHLENYKEVLEDWFVNTVSYSRSPVPFWGLDRSVNSFMTEIDFEGIFGKVIKDTEENKKKAVNAFKIIEALQVARSSSPSADLETIRNVIPINHTKSKKEHFDILYKSIVKE